MTWRDYVQYNTAFTGGGLPQLGTRGVLSPKTSVPYAACFERGLVQDAFSHAAQRIMISSRYCIHTERGFAGKSVWQARIMMHYDEMLLLHSTYLLDGQYCRWLRCVRGPWRRGGCGPGLCLTVPPGSCRRAIVPFRLIAACPVGWAILGWTVARGETRHLLG